MPIEIKELHVHVSVNTSPSGQHADGQQMLADESGSNDDKEALIAECVEKVLQILQNKKER
jgi:hypothetical protein